jgi:hypothetical protein
MLSFYSGCRNPRSALAGLMLLALAAPPPLETKALCRAMLNFACVARRVSDAFCDLV